MLNLGKVINAFLGRPENTRNAKTENPHFSELKSIGIGVEIGPNVLIDFNNRVSIGDYVYIGSKTQLYGRGGLDIHDHVIIGPDVVVLTSLHNYKQANLIPYDEVELLRPVIIGWASWIGIRVIIMPGVVIGEGSIVGAGAVVTKSCPPGSVLGGNPAQLIGQRDMDHFRKCGVEDKFYLKIKQKTGLEKREIVVSNTSHP